MKEIKNKKCKFCKIIFPTNKKTEFCSDICKYNWKKKNGDYTMGVCRRNGDPSYEYVCRMLTTKNKTGDAYGITIPRKLVEKYNLLGKKFKIDIGKKGIFNIRTQINYVELKGK